MVTFPIYYNLTKKPEGKESMSKKQNRRTRKFLDQEKKRTRRIYTYSVLVIGVLVLAGYLLIQAFSSPKLQPVSDRVIDIEAKMGGFNMQVIRVKTGEPITIRLTSLDNQFHTDGGGQHQWAVDEFNVSVIAQPKSSSMVTFVPTTPGTYTFYCDICCGGRANPAMQGTLIVEA
jgi:heme/copper-type cytochrome/quinol oxidase subunit 2